MSQFNSQPAQCDPAALAGILTFDQAAQALNTDKLGIQRLVARGRIPFVYVGGAEKRISTAALAKYVADGAGDAAGFPPHNTSWFIDGYGADNFAEMLAAIAGADLPSAPKVIAALVRAEVGEVSISRAVELGLALNDNARKFVLKKSADPKYESAGAAYSASKLRDSAKRVINQGSFVASPITYLYSDEKTYTAVTIAALERFKRLTAFAFTKFYAESPTSPPVAVSWTITNAQIRAVLGMSDADLIRIAF